MPAPAAAPAAAPPATVPLPCSTAPFPPMHAAAPHAGTLLCLQLPMHAVCACPPPIEAPVPAVAPLTKHSAAPCCFLCPRPRHRAFVSLLPLFFAPLCDSSLAQQGRLACEEGHEGVLAGGRPHNEAAQPVEAVGLGQSVLRSAEGRAPPLPPAPLPPPAAAPSTRTTPGGSWGGGQGGSSRAPSTDRYPPCALQ
jgi:hypothetical protein